MKIAWYTPYSIHSAIAHFSTLVVRELRARGVEVLVVRSEMKSAELRALAPACREERYAWASDLDRSPATQLADYDLAVYNVGDHHDYHAYCFSHQPQVPGLTILHDFSLHHALYRYCVVNPAVNAGYREHLCAERGSEALDRYDERVAADNERHWWQNDIADFPVYRWALESTEGVVTHAQFYRDTVAQTLGCPVTTIPLAYDSPLDQVRQPAASHATNGRCVVLTVGAVNPNKRHEAVIRAIGSSSRLSERCEFRIVGDIDDASRQQLLALSNSQPQRVNVTVTGRVDRSELQRELTEAHVISCLRSPALEGASASVIEALLCEKPVIVSETGCYREIPADAVFKVSPTDEIDELRRALEGVVARPDEAARRAAWGRRWATQRHSPRAYAEQFLEFAANVLYNRPVLAAVDRVADQLRQWNLAVDDCIAARLDAVTQDLFGGVPSAGQRRAA